jgi:osmotically-inducible protein OsmY
MEATMNERYRTDRSRGGQASNDSEWTRDRAPRYGGEEGSYVQAGGYGHGGTFAQGRGYGSTPDRDRNVPASSFGAGSTRGDGQIAWGDSPSRPSGGFAGRGPKGYVRSDERIREDVCDRLSVDDDIDASDLEVSVEAGEVTLEGTVQTRSMKHHAENLADEVVGVKDVHNRLRVRKGLLTEIKDKLTGEEAERHYANGGTKHHGSA